MHTRTHSNTNSQSCFLTRTHTHTHTRTEALYSLWSSWWLRSSHTLIVISCREDAVLLFFCWFLMRFQAEVTLGCSCWLGSSCGWVWSCWGWGWCWSWGCDCDGGWTWSGGWACCWGWLSPGWEAAAPELLVDWVDSWDSCSLLARDFSTAFSLSNTEFLSYSSLICSFKTSTSSRTAYIRWLFTRSWRRAEGNMKWELTSGRSHCLITCIHSLHWTHS